MKKKNRHNNSFSQTSREKKKLSLFTHLRRVPPAVPGAERRRRPRPLGDVGPRQHQRQRVCRIGEASHFDQAGDDGRGRRVPERAPGPARVPLVDDHRRPKPQRRGHRRAVLGHVRGLDLVPLRRAEVLAQVLEDLHRRVLEGLCGVEDVVEDGHAQHHGAAAVLRLLCWGVGVCGGGRRRRLSKIKKSATALSFSFSFSLSQIKPKKNSSLPKCRTGRTAPAEAGEGRRTQLASASAEESSM